MTNPHEAEVAVRCWCGHVENEYGIHRAEADLPAPPESDKDEGWWPEYCAKHAGYHMQSPLGGTGYLFKTYADADTAARALNDLERGKLIPAQPPPVSQSVEEARELVLDCIWGVAGSRVSQNVVVDALAAFERAVTGAANEAKS